MAASRDHSLRVETLKKYTNRGSCYSSYALIDRYIIANWIYFIFIIIRMESDEDELNNSSPKDHYLDLPEGRPRAGI